LAGFPTRFTWALDDLRALVSAHPIIAEGWGLPPELVAPLLDSPRRMVVMMATDAFRRHQLRRLARARTLGTPVSDPTQAQQNRLARDRIIADHAVDCARRVGIRVIEIDGTQDAEHIANVLADHFSPHLPPRATT
jgi:2-phosphoglycerate kinase